MKSVYGKVLLAVLSLLAAAMRATDLNAQIPSQSACTGASSSALCEISQAKGFDTTCVQPKEVMSSAWGLPYTFAGVYLGGKNVSCYPNYLLSSTCNVDPNPACSPSNCPGYACHSDNDPCPGNPYCDSGGVKRCKLQDLNLNSDWMNDVRGFGSSTEGWGVAPIWLGYQAPCADPAYDRMVSDDPTCGNIAASVCAANEGGQEADDAACAAGSLGIDHSVVYYDLEPYDASNAPCATAVTSFVNAWVQELHKKGFVAGVYDASSRAAQLYPGVPDAIWYAGWNGLDTTQAPVLDGPSLWTQHSRIHQLCSDPMSECNDNFPDLPGFIPVDGDRADGPVVPGRHLPAPTSLSPCNATGVSTTPKLVWTGASDPPFTGSS